DLWYRFHAPLGGSLRATTCGTANHDPFEWGMDTVLALYNGCPGNAAHEIACNDDALGVCNDDAISNESAVIGHTSANQELLIRVSGLSDIIADGYFQLHTTFLTADLNGDCQVSLADLALLLSMFGQTGANLLADINGDGQVSLDDLALMLS